jgi:hypothetical protein
MAGCSGHFKIALGTVPDLRMTFSPTAFSGAVKFLVEEGKWRLNAEFRLQRIA